MDLRASGPRALSPMGRAGMMLAEHRIHTVPLQQHEVRKGAEIAIPQHHIARCQKGAQVVEEPLFMFVEGAEGILDHRTRREGHQGHQT